MDAWTEITHYDEWVQACLSNDQGRQTAILERRLAEAEGPEKAFWLRARARLRVKGTVVPQISALAWTDLEEALHVTAEGHPEWAATLASAMDLCVTTELFEQAAPTFSKVNWLASSLRREPLFWHSLGYRHIKRRNWPGANRAYTRAIQAFEALPLARQGRLQCRQTHNYAWRAVARAAIGQMGPASADVAQAFTRAGACSHGVQFAILGLAKAEVAFQAGRLQEARSALQQGLMLDHLEARRKLAPSQVAETELFAARMARAEGNMVGFVHFCDRALSLCDQHDLPLTRTCVIAVRAGAER